MSWTIVIYILLSVWVCLFGGQKEGICFLGGGFVVEILLFISFRKFTKFSMPKPMGKETMILILNISHKVYFCNFGYLLFFHYNKVWWKNLFSYFNFYFFICSGMVNHSSTIAPLGKEGWTSLVGFKSHRLPYWQQWLKNIFKIQCWFKFIVGHNHPELWDDQLRETTNSQQITKFKANY